MKCWPFFALTLLALASHVSADFVIEDGNEDVDDGDFSEFDVEFEEKTTRDEKKDVTGSEDEELEDEVVVEEDDDGDEAIVEDVDNEFSHFADEEEFVGYNSEDEEDEEDEFEHMSTKGRGAKEKRHSSTQQQKVPPPRTIKFANIPAHLRTSWKNYYLEIVMAFGIVVYFINFFTGKSKNQRIANAWFSSHKTLLESNFSLVGDDGAKNIDDIETALQKESENVFTLWCSGRTCCEGMLVELRLLKRQDLVSVVTNAIKPAHDQVKVRVNMAPDDMDTFVFCLARKKAATRLSKEMSDINTFCPEKRPANLEKYGLTSAASVFQVMSEISEVSSAILGDSKLVAVLNKYPDAIDSIHFSDQYTGPKLSDDQAPAELPEGKKVLLFTFNLSGLRRGLMADEAAEAAKPLMLLVLYFVDKMKRLRLSREARVKAEKNRSKVAEAFWKSIHAAKAERAQEERERKRREMKDKIREMDDPDRQRKLEERELRRERKKAAPKMKQLKVKAM